MTLGESKLLGQYFQTSMGTDYYPFGMQQPQKVLNLHWQRSSLPKGPGGERGPSPHSPWKAPPLAGSTPPTARLWLRLLKG